MERGGPLSSALSLTMPVRSAATTAMGGATTAAMGSCSAAAGVRRRAAAITAARSRVSAAGRSVCASLRRITAIAGRRVSLWRVRATTGGTAAPSSRSACTSPRWAIIPARGHSVVRRAVGAAKAVRGPAMIRRIALRAPRACVVGASRWRMAPRSPVLPRGRSAVVCSAGAQSVGVHRVHGTVRSTGARRRTRHDGAVLD
jgi:hypothetical protein